MEEELHRLLREALGEEAMRPIWAEIVKRERATYEMNNGAIQGWRDRVAELELGRPKLFAEGMKQGLKCYAWWKNGVEYVGSGVDTLKAALAEVSTRLKDGEYDKPMTIEGEVL